jgi:hypothetical protein
MIVKQVSQDLLFQVMRCPFGKASKWEIEVYLRKYDTRLTFVYVIKPHMFYA